jgi:AraC-like DNA-binding protein
MKLIEIRLPQEQGKSLIFYHETHPFARWHNHPEYEICLITRGRGKRMVGDHIDRFEENDLLFLGPYLPHEWLCDEEYFTDQGFNGECIVIQFYENSIGNTFLDLPENINLKNFLFMAGRGCKVIGETCNQIAAMLRKTIAMNNTDRLYTVLAVFRILALKPEYILLASPSFIESFRSKENEPIKKVIQYILQNFQEEIRIQTLLELANMSNTSFCIAFKKTYRMTFQEYLKTVRVGYACRLLTEGIKTISEIAYASGFENISNFNRQFKHVKGLTPSAYKLQVEKM